MEEGKPKPESPLYVFTDAPPLDKAKVDDALALALDTWTTVHVFYGTSNCLKSIPDDTFHHLVSETNGQELTFSHGTEISQVLFIYYNK